MSEIGRGKFAYFIGGLIVGAICVLLPFLCVLPIILQQARVGDQLQAKLTRAEADLARYHSREQNQRFPPPPPFSDSYPPPPPPPNDNAYPRPPQRPPFENE